MTVLKRIKVTYDKDGEPVELVIKGRKFECCDGIALVPLKVVGDVKLEEVPEGILMKPISHEEKSGTIPCIIPVKYGFMLDVDVNLSSDGAYVDIVERAKYWEFEIGINSFMKLFLDVLRKLRMRTRIIRDIEYSVDDDYYNIGFLIPLRGDHTCRQAVHIIRNFFKVVEEELMLEILDYYEQRLAAWRRVVKNKNRKTGSRMRVLEHHRAT